MSPAKVDRKLRRLVTDLAALGREDADAILSALSTRQRRQVETLLHSYSIPNVQTAEAKPFDRTAISPWLAQRIDVPSRGQMTTVAHEALLACAAEVLPLSNGKAPGGRVRR